MAVNLDFSNFNVDLSGLGGFNFDPSSLSYLMQDTTADPSPLDIRKAEIAAEVAAKASQQPVQSVGQTADLSTYYDALRQGTTVSDVNTVGQSYNQALAEALADQGIVDTGYAEGGGVADKPTVSSFTTPDYAPRELGEFQGNLSAHTSSSLAQIKEFQSRLEPLMAPEIARLQAVEKLDYRDAVEQAYIQNPEIKALYNAYDVKPFRTTEDGSIYLYDPFTFGEIRTLEVKDKDLQKALKAVAQIGASVLTSGAGAALGLTGASAAATSAAVSGFTTAAQGGDKDAILNSVLMAGGTTLLKGAVDKVKQGVENVAEETLQAVSPELSVELPEIVSDNVVDTVTGTLTGADNLSASYDVLDRVIADIGVDRLNAMSNTDLYNYLSSAGDIAGINTLGLTPFQRTVGFMNAARPLRQDLIREGITSTGPSFAPDIFGGTATETLPFEYTPSRVDFTLPDTPIPEVRPTLVRPQPPTQTPGGGGGASSAAASAPAMSVVAPSAPSATITPAVLPPMLTAPGSVTNALLTNTLSALASSSFSASSAPSTTSAPQPTVAPPVTPVATTAPTPEPTPVTTTEPTDIFEDTTAEDTTAQVEAEAEAQAEAQRQAAREAEAARLAEEARKAAEARAAAEAKAAAEQEAIAQAEARAVAAEARLAEQQAQAQADAAAAEAARAADSQAQADALAEAVAAGEALGEAQYGEGLGTGRGQGAGAGLGAGLGLGLLSGLMGGQGGTGGTGGYTPPEFEDYQFRKTYQAPELLELAPQYQSYQPPALQGLFKGLV